MAESMRPGWLTPPPPPPMGMFTQGGFPPPPGMAAAGGIQASPGGYTWQKGQAPTNIQGSAIDPWGRYVPGYGMPSDIPSAKEPEWNPFGGIGPNRAPTRQEWEIAQQLVGFGPPWHSVRSSGQRLNYSPEILNIEWGGAGAGPSPTVPKGSARGSAAVPSDIGAVTARAPDLTTQLNLGGRRGTLGQALAARNALDLVKRGLNPHEFMEKRAWRRVNTPGGGYTYVQVDPRTGQRIGGE